MYTKNSDQKLRFSGKNIIYCCPVLSEILLMILLLCMKRTKKDLQVRVETRKGYPRVSYHHYPLVLGPHLLSNLHIVGPQGVHFIKLISSCSLYELFLWPHTSATQFKLFTQQLYKHLACSDHFWANTTRLLQTGKLCHKCSYSFDL